MRYRTKSQEILHKTGSILMLFFVLGVFGLGLISMAHGILSLFRGGICP